MDFLWITVAMFIVFTVALIVMIASFVLGAMGIITLNGAVWVLLAFLFLVLSLIELIFYWLIRSEIEQRRENKK